MSQVNLDDIEEAYSRIKTNVTGPWDFTLTLDNAMNEDYYTDMEVSTDWFF